MSKKIIKLLEDSTTRIEHIFLNNSSKKDFNQLVALKNTLSNQLKSEHSSNLKDSLLFINDIMLRNSDGLIETPGSEHLQIERRILQFKKEVIEEALKKRNKSSKDRKDPIEKNYGLAPIFAPSSPNQSTLTTIRNEYGHIVETRSGYRTIEYSASHGGYLTPYDFKIFVGLQKMWEMKGGIKEFEFHLGELCEILEEERAGGTYELLITGLNKLSTTSITMHDYRDGNTAKPYKTRIHNVIQNAEIDHEEKTVYIIFNDYLHNGLTAGNIAHISLTTYQDLSSKTSKILYPLISSIINETNQLDVDDLIATLNLVDVPRHKALERIRKSLNELVDYEIISSYELIRQGKPYKYILISPTEDMIENLDDPHSKSMLFQ